MNILQVVNDFKSASQPKTCGDISHCNVDKCKEPATQYVNTGLIPVFLCYHHFRDFTREISYPGILAKEQINER